MSLLSHTYLSQLFSGSLEPVNDCVCVCVVVDIRTCVLVGVCACIRVHYKTIITQLSKRMSGSFIMGNKRFGGKRMLFGIQVKWVVNTFYSTIFLIVLLDVVYARLLSSHTFST